MKSLAILTVVFCLSAMACYQQASAQKHQAPAPNEVPSTITVHNEDHSTHEQQKENNVPRWWPEGVTAIAIILTLFAIAYQSYYTRIAAEAAKAGTETARENIQLVMNLERGRIAVTPTPLGEYSYMFMAKNIGRTSAKLIDIAAYSLTIDRGETLPDSPPYLIDERQTNVIWVATGTDIPLQQKEYTGEPSTLIAKLDGQATRNNIAIHGSNLWIFGRILYLDGISPLERECRFCFQMLVNSGDKTSFLAGGPTQYWMDT
jgi:hypothetical protein